MTANQINYFKAREEQRANIAREAIQTESNRIAEINANANAANAATNAAALDETKRHNAQVELLNAATLTTVEQPKVAETQRHQVAVEQETVRSNQASEANEKRRQNFTLGSALVNTASNLLGGIVKVLA